MSKKYSLGIDLGTSNSCLALCPVSSSAAHGIDVTQILAPGVVGERHLLPSALYIPAPGEYAPGSLDLPWHGPSDANAVIGSFARERGALVPDRLVSSAKSWLCNPHVDRHAPILPWQSDLADGKLSPFEASRRYLEHLRHAAEHHLAAHEPGATLDDCQVVLTVPASFDEVARSLTHEAAAAAGLGNVSLLEEPQAAFYAWIAHSEAASATEHWTAQVSAGDLILVCDVGGGTADFSLIAVAEAPSGLSKQLELHRIAVGEHILLGGDNMDLALAYVLQARLEEEGHTLDDWQFLALIHAGRIAKEKLLSDDSLAEAPIAVPSRGSSLFAKTLATRLTRADVTAILLEGYFPLTAADEQPAPRKSAGLQEYGLDYATEPALSKHLARFLKRSLENVRSDAALRELINTGSGHGVDLDSATILHPTDILFNGGVFAAPIFRRRLLDLLSSWFAGAPPKELQGAGLDSAVSRGAAYYGAVQAAGKGIKIRAGTSRSFYLGLESPMPAVPGFVPPVKGICIVPQGTEEGTELALPGKEFGLVTGEAVAFRFFASEIRAGDRIGDVVPNAVKSLEELASLTLTLPPLAGASGQVVPVSLHPQVTGVGTLELWLQHTQSAQRWKLEFNLRARD